MATLELRASREGARVLIGCIRIAAVRRGVGRPLSNTWRPFSANSGIEMDHPLNDERIQFFLRHRDDIRAWAAIERELPAIVREMLASCQEHLDEQLASIGSGRNNFAARCGAALGADLGPSAMAARGRRLAGMGSWSRPLRLRSAENRSHLPEQRSRSRSTIRLRTHRNL